MANENYTKMSNEELLAEIKKGVFLKMPTYLTRRENARAETCNFV